MRKAPNFFVALFAALKGGKAAMNIPRKGLRPKARSPPLQKV